MIFFVDDNITRISPAKAFFRADSAEGALGQQASINAAHDESSRRGRSGCRPHHRVRELNRHLEGDEQALQHDGGGYARALEKLRRFRIRLALHLRYDAIRPQLRRDARLRCTQLSITAFNT